jgi:hypothetical protein
MLMTMSLGRDYVSELRSPTGLLFTHQVTFEHGEPWWNDIDRGKLLIRPPKLSGSPATIHLVPKEEEVANEMINFALRSIFVYISKEGVLRIFIALKIYCPRPGLGLMASTLNITPPRTTKFM